MLPQHALTVVKYGNSLPAYSAGRQDDRQQIERAEKTAKLFGIICQGIFKF